jgi:hypothetical protein
MLIRVSYLLLILTIAIAAFLVVHFSQQRSEQIAAFTGVERCAVCHAAESAGAQIAIWQRSQHARAYQAVLSDAAKGYLKEHHDSIAPCLACHTTLGRSAYNRREETVNAQGVGCERCHGTGSVYAYYNIMRERTAFVANGGVVGSLKDCSQCHAADLAKMPGHCPFQMKNFNADSGWAQIRHPIPRNLPKPDTVLELRK